MKVSPIRLVRTGLIVAGVYMLGVEGLLARTDARLQAVALCALADFAGALAITAMLYEASV